MTAPWHGNVRELRNVIERACILAESETITERDLARALAAAVEHAEGAPAGGSGGASLSSLERAHIVRVLRETGGNKQAAARLLGVSRRALYRRLYRHGLVVAHD